MFQTALSSFLALFVPGLICLTPVILFAVQSVSGADKYLSLLMLPFAYVAGWAIYEYSYYTRRGALRQLRAESWNRHVAKLAQCSAPHPPATMLLSIPNGDPAQASARIHLAFSVVLQKGSDSLVRRVQYYLDSFRMLVCVPLAFLLGLIGSACGAFGAWWTNSHSLYAQFVGLLALYVLFVILLSLLNLALARPQTAMKVPDARLVDKALYQVGWERMDQWVASLALALTAMEFSAESIPAQNDDPLQISTDRVSDTEHDAALDRESARAPSPPVSWPLCVSLEAILRCQTMLFSAVVSSSVP